MCKRLNKCRCANGLLTSVRGPFQASDFAVCRSEEASVDVHWSTATREDVKTWHENSVYRVTRALLVVDRAVQSELTTRTVAEDCLAVTADAVNEEPTPPLVVSQDGLEVVSRPPGDDQQGVVVEDLGDVDVVVAVSVQRRDSYQQAIVNTTVDNSWRTPTDLEDDGQTADDIQQSALETVSEEPDVDDAPNEPEETIGEDVDVVQSTEANADEVVECDNEPADIRMQTRAFRQRITFNRCL